MIGNFELSPVGVMSGIKTMAWARSGQFLAVSCSDDKIRLLNHITWQPVAEFSHHDVILDNDCTVHQECLARDDPSKVSFELVCGRPVIISSLQWDQDKPTELSGIGLAVFSSCGYFLATREDTMPAAIWIWSIKETRLHSVIVHKQPVTAVCWAPDEPRLAIVCGSNFVSLWVGKEVTVHMTYHICVSDVRWQPSGECLLLYAGTKVVFLPLSLF
jgi:WD40 repeat protein